MKPNGEEGSFLLDVDDITDWPAFCSRLRDGEHIVTPNPSRRILSLLPQKVRATISAGASDTTNESKSALIGSLNEILKQRDFYQATEFGTVIVDDDIKTLLNRNQAELTEQEIQKLNRLILETTYPEIKPVKLEPYVGPRSFKKSQRGFFFGRDEEAIELASLITAHSAILLYSQSGAGKTSLLNAKLIPKLEEEEFFHVLPPMRVQGQLPSSLKVGKKNNIFVLNALMSCCKGNGQQFQPGMTFAQFLAGREQHFNQYGEPSPTVLVFDQFEELFTSYPSRWPDRQTFFEQLAEALEGNSKTGVEGDPLLRVIFCMREDYIAELDPYLYLLPEKLRSRFRLEHLREHKALVAITKPLEKTDRVFGKGVAEQLVKNLIKVPSQSITGTQTVGLYVEPVQLQVVCQSLWEALTPEETVITRKHLEKYGDVTQALSNFYERSIRSVAAETKIKEERLRNWFGNTLITSEGTRAPVNRGNETTGGMPNIAVDKLEAIRLIKGEWKGTNVRWYELAHDRFVEPIRASNERWLAAQSRSEQIRLRLEAKASKWEPGSSVLDPVELLEGQKLAKAAMASKALQALVDASRASAQRERIHRLKWVGALAAGLAVVFFVLAVFALIQTKQARKAWALAESRLLATRADMARAVDPELSVLLAKEALDKYADSEQAKDIIRQGLMNLSDVAGAFWGHQDKVINCSFSPDGRHILTTSADGTARLWDVGTRSLLKQLGNDTVRYATISSDGKHIVTAERDGVTHLWDANSGELIRTLTGHRADVVSAAFSHNGKYLATASDDNTARVWSVETGELFKELTGHIGPLVAIAFSPDNTRVATEAADQTGIIWDLQSNKYRRLEGLTGPTPAIAFSQDGKLLATEGGLDTEGGYNERIGFPVTVWEVSTGKPRLVLEGHEKFITGVVFSPDNKYIATSSADNTARVWNLEGYPLFRLEAHTKTVSSVVFSSDSQMLVTTSADNTARVWNLAQGKLRVSRLMGHSGALNSSAFSPDNKWLITASDDKSVRLWQMDQLDNHVQGPLTEHAGGVTSASFSPDGALALTTDSVRGTYLEDLLLGVPSPRALLATKNSARVVDAAFSPDGQVVATTNNKYAVLWKATGIQGPFSEPLRAFGESDGHTGDVNSVAFSQDGKLLLTASADASVRVWDVGSGSSVGLLEGHTKRVNTAAFSPDGKFIVTASDDKEVRLWDAATYGLVRTIGNHKGEVTSASYSPDGQFIVSTSGNVATIWSASTSTLVRELSGHLEKVNKASFSPDSKLIVTSSADKTARVWDVRSGKSISVLRGHSSNVVDAEFSRDGRYILTASDDYTASIFAYSQFAPFEEILALIPKRVARTLTDQQRKQLLEAGEIALTNQKQKSNPSYNWFFLDMLGLLIAIR